MNLIQHLQTVRDYHTQPEYPLWVILVLVIMGTMSGCIGYRPLADFVERHQNDLLEIMGLPQERLPSYRPCGASRYELILSPLRKPLIAGHKSPVHPPPASKLQWMAKASEPACAIMTSRTKTLSALSA